jgi:hypothetical protein
MQIEKISQRIEIEARHHKLIWRIRLACESMAIPVIEFQVRGYKIINIFA